MKTAATPSDPPPRSAYAALVGMTFAFGLSFTATKVALHGFQPLLLALLRFTGAGVILWSILRLRSRREKLDRDDLRKLALLGFVSLTVYFTFENIGIAHTSASDAAILIATIPVFVSLLDLFTLREGSSRRQWAGIALSFVGVAALIEAGAGGGSGATLGGDLLVLTASLTAAVYNLMARKLLVTRSALQVTTYQNLFGALFMLPLAAGEAAVMGVRTPTTAASAGLLYLTVMCSVVAYLLINYGLRFVPAARASSFANLVPVVAVGAAYVVLGERLAPLQWVAAGVVVVGVWLANRGERPRSPSAG